MFTGPHGYVSASWYGEDTILTWNHVTLILQGRAELFDDALPVLRRTVDHFEAAVEQPWSPDRMGETARPMADEVIAFRVLAECRHLEAKLSQEKPADERARHGLPGSVRQPAARARDARVQPLTTPIGRSSATRAASPARSTTSTTFSTSL